MKEQQVSLSGRDTDTLEFEAFDAFDARTETVELADGCICAGQRHGGVGAPMDAPSEELELFVPGRICLLGEHSDWSGPLRKVNPDIAPGLTIVCGINYGGYWTRP